jgi:metal-dependent HD superfamily phosphatase/phosphodiesterase
VRRLVVFKQMLHTLHKGKEVLEVVEGHYTQSTDDERVNEVFDHRLERLIKYHEYILLKYEGVIKRNESEEFDILRENGLFMNRVMELYEGSAEQLRLVLVGSSVFDYGFQLHRLERLVEHWLGKAVR